MAKFEKVLHGDLDEINQKLAKGICVICSKTQKRGSWTTAAGNVRCIVTVFERYAAKVFRDDDWQPQPHCSLSLTLFDTGEEIRLCAITAGSGPDSAYFFSSGDEKDLMSALKSTLDILDDII